jgi:hypothetical protein
LAVVLQRSIAGNLPGLDGGIGTLAALSERGREAVASGLADAFGTTFWVAFALLAAAFVPALLLPRVSPAREAATAVGGPR